MAASRFSSVPEAVRTTTSDSGAAARILGSASRPPVPGIVRSRRTMSGRSARARSTACSPSPASPTTLRPCCSSRPTSAERVSGWSSATSTRRATGRLIGSGARADKRGMRPKTRVYAAWVRDELVLVTLLGGALALVLALPSFRPASELPALRLFLDTGVALLALVVSVLAYVRLSVEGRRFDLFLASGFSVAAVSTLAFTVGPMLGGDPLAPAESWAAIFGRLLAGLLLAAAPFVR